MNKYYKTSLSIALIALISGCSGKSFTMQEYADKWFNDEHPQTKEEIQVDKEQEKAVDTVEKKRESIQESKSIVEEEPTPQTQEEPVPKQETQASSKKIEEKSETSTYKEKETLPQNTKDIKPQNELPAKTTKVEKTAAATTAVVATSPKPKSKTINPGKSTVGSSIAPSSVNKRDTHMKGQGAMQSGLDTWTKEEWEPAFKDDENQTIKDEEANKHFTIQHYIDKYSKYSKSKDKEWEESVLLFPEIPGTRQIFEVQIESVQTSCGMTVPFFDFVDHRNQLSDFAKEKGTKKIEQYWKERNSTSIDGISTGI
jgi:hypothetical protein